MKKILALFALCAIFVACGGLTIEERCDNYAKERKEICDVAVELNRSDVKYQEQEAKFWKLTDEFEGWLFSLPKDEKEKAIDYLQESYEKYPTSCPW